MCLQICWSRLGLVARDEEHYLTDSWQHSGRTSVPLVCVRMDTKLQHLGLVKQSGALGPALQSEGASEVTLGLTLVFSILKLVYFLSR